MRHYLGPDVALRGLGFTASESYIGIVYDEKDTNLFKVVGADDIIEYLDVEQEDSTASLSAAVC